MNIMIHLSNDFIAEAISRLLVTNGYDDVVVSGRSPTNGFRPHVLLVDVTTVKYDLLSQYPQAKVVLIDTGVEPEELCATVFAYRIHGVLSPDTELHLLKKALNVVTKDQLWIDNGSVKALLHDRETFSESGRITAREQEIIGHVRQGLSNKEIAQRLALSPCTVKVHLNRIFGKLSIASRSKLMALALDRPQTP